MSTKKNRIQSGLTLLSAVGAGCALLFVSTANANVVPAKDQKSTKSATQNQKAAPRSQSPGNTSPTQGDMLRQMIRSLEMGEAVANAGWLPNAPTDADYRPVVPEQAELGKLLFHDKILSGNMNISCATCHNMTTDTSDGLSLPIGEGAMGLGPVRDTGYGDDAVHERVPRNAPHVFNIGAFEFDTMMHDGRIAENPHHPAGFDTPAGDDLLPGLDSVVAAQACFPVTSATEMAGQPGENPVADAADAGDFQLLWSILTKRVASNNEYFELFAEAFDDINHPMDITYAHIANAIAAYEFDVGRADNSPFDRFMRGDSGAMSMNAVQGMMLFYGQAGCADCHSGPFQTNHEFRAIGMPQIGPGKGHNQPGYSDGRDDLGLGAETGNPADNFKFRVPSLRNVALTGPWTHSGAYGTLEAVVRHHLNPVESLLNYDPDQAVLPYRDDLAEQDFVVMNDKNRVLGILAANELGATHLTDDEFDALMAFLHALTDPNSIDLRHAIPMSVPSGLPVFD